MSEEKRKEIASAGGRAGAGKKRGFACLSPERRKEIASRGGKSAHKKGRAHEWSKAEAAAAGRRGGTEAAKRRRIRKAEESDRQVDSSEPPLETAVADSSAAETVS